MRVQASPPQDFAWLAKRTGYAPGADFCALEAVDAAGRIRGMVGFDHWMPNSAQAHLALDSPAAARALLPAALDYFFAKSGRSVAIGLVPTSNAKSLRLARHLGFRTTHLIRGGWAPGVDVAVLELHQADCRFLKENTP